MPDETQTRRDNALDFLDELDGRHDLLLAELELLNQRLDSVLGAYSKSRQSAALTSSLGVELSADVDSLEVLLGNHGPLEYASKARAESADFE
jgi:hypothetical protein